MRYVGYTIKSLGPNVKFQCLGEYLGYGGNWKLLIEHRHWFAKSCIHSWASYVLDRHYYEFGALLLLGFFALLRAGKLLAKRPKDLLIGQETGIVSLYQTKTGQRDNVAEMVAFGDFFTLEFVRVIKQRLPTEDRYNIPIWCHSAQSFRNQFK